MKALLVLTQLEIGAPQWTERIQTVSACSLSQNDEVHNRLLVRGAVLSLNRVPATLSLSIVSTLILSNCALELVGFET